MSDLVNFQELACRLHLGRSQLRAYVAAGMPIAIAGGRGRGHKARFDAAVCAAWVAHRRGADTAPAVAVPVAPAALCGFVLQLDQFVRTAPESARAAVAFTAIAAWQCLVDQLPADFAREIPEPVTVAQWRALADARGHRIGKCPTNRT
jgi:hypothetical protein